MAWYRFMPLTSGRQRSWSRDRRWTGLFLATWVMGLGIGAQALAQSPYDDTQTPEGWAWAQITQGKPADFNGRCGTPALDPRADDEARWTDNCRRLPAAFLVDVLTHETRRKQVPFAGVKIIGARIEGDIDLHNANLDRELVVEQTRIENNINLESARTNSDVSVVGSRVAGSVSAQQLHGGLSLILSNTAFKQKVDLNDAKIDGYIDMSGAIFGEDLDADSLQVGSSLYMQPSEQNKTSFKGVNLRSAKITGKVDMSGASFERGLNAESLHVGADLSMDKASFNDVNLTIAKISGNVLAVGAVFDGPLNAISMDVGAHLLMGSIEQNKSSFKDVNLGSAKVAGNFSMSGVALDGKLDTGSIMVGANFLLQSTDQNKASFKGVSLVGAKIAGLVSLVGVTLDGDLEAAALQGAGLVMQSTEQHKASFKGVTLGGAKISGNVSMFGVIFDGDLEAGALQVGADLIMQSVGQSKASFKGVKLGGAKISGNVSISGVIFDGDLEAGALQVGADLSMGLAELQTKASFKGVNLAFARITGNAAMGGATFEGNLNALSMQVGGHLLMSAAEPFTASFKKVLLGSAKITGNLMIDDATLDGDLDATSLQVGGDVFLRNATCTQRVDMIFARIGANLDVSGATLAELRLSGATIAGEFVLGGGDTANKPAVWLRKDGSPGALKLYNTRVANLVDAENAWPARGNLGLEGFAFTRLGGFDGATASQMRGRGMDWWDGWVRRDPSYSTTPYEQLAAALVLAGERGAADEIRFLGRVRQRENEKHWGAWIFSGFLQYVAGFGIGTYTFRVLFWVMGISAAGALYLWTCVEAARAHGPIWCFGASFTRLLPMIEINKEFSDFFNDPERSRLTGEQSAVFSVIRIVGWVLGAILIGAISGLTQKA
jgi:uncharacterized protein YjbI with pentapeptide repeats